MPLIFVFAGSQAGTGDTLGVALGFGGALAAFLLSGPSARIFPMTTRRLLSTSPQALTVGRIVGACHGRGVSGAAAGTCVRRRWWRVIGDLVQLVATVGLVLGVVGSGLGLASVFSSRFTTNAPLPGESPMKTRPGNGLSSALIQLAGFGGLEC